MVSEEKFMETLKAVIVEDDDKDLFIEIDDKKKIHIPITYDDPKEVKNSFNKLLVRLKKGDFNIELDDEGDDLFTQVAKEYLNQLNSELSEVYEEMENLELVDDC